MSAVVTLPDIDQNHARNPTEAKLYPTKNYPLRLNITFSRQAVLFQKHLKKTLNGISKDQVRYRQTGKYLFSYDCYANNAESLKPIIDGVLTLSQMWVRCGAEKSDYQLSTADIKQAGQKIMQSASL